MKKKHLLLGCKGCGSAIAESAFAVSGIPLDYEEVDYGAGSPTRARLLEVNPLGQVPTRVLPDGRILTESLAIVNHVNDLAPQAKLIPFPREETRVGFLRWSTFLVAALYPTWTYGDEPAKWVEEPKGAKQLRESTDRHRQVLWQQVEEAASAPYFLGETLSAIDLYIACMTHWRPGRKWFLANTPRLVAIAEKTSATAGVADVMRKNF